MRFGNSWELSWGKSGSEIHLTLGPPLGQSPAQAAREKELEEFKDTNSDFEKMMQRQKSDAGAVAPVNDSEADQARAQLRQELARKLKQVPKPLTL